MRAAIVLLAGVLAGVPVSMPGLSGAMAGELRFGLSDQADVDRAEQRLNDILLGPVAPPPDARDTTEPNAALKGILRTNPALAEAFRVNPKETLKLIDLIQDAGGLAQ